MQLNEDAEVELIEDALMHFFPDATRECVAREDIENWLKHRKVDKEDSNENKSRE